VLSWLAVCRPSQAGQAEPGRAGAVQRSHLEVVDALSTRFLARGPRRQHRHELVRVRCAKIPGEVRIVRKQAHAALEIQDGSAHIVDCHVAGAIDGCARDPAIRADEVFIERENRVGVAKQVRDISTVIELVAEIDERFHPNEIR